MKLNIIILKTCVAIFFPQNFFKELEDPTLFIWLGGSDLSGTWTWERSGNTFNFTNWAPNQPSGRDEHCAHLVDAGGDTWNDRPCDDAVRQSALCELLFDC